jgi:hypothetical protein
MDDAFVCQASVLHEDGLGGDALLHGPSGPYPGACGLSASPALDETVLNELPAFSGRGTVVPTKRLGRLVL